MYWDSEEYGEKKREAEDFLWNAFKESVPNNRDREVKLTLQVGKP